MSTYELKDIYVSSFDPSGTGDETKDDSYELTTKEESDASLLLPAVQAAESEPEPDEPILTPSLPPVPPQGPGPIVDEEPADTFDFKVEEESETSLLLPAVQADEVDPETTDEFASRDDGSTEGTIDEPLWTNSTTLKGRGYTEEDPLEPYVSTDGFVFDI